MASKAIIDLFFTSSVFLGVSNGRRKIRRIHHFGLLAGVLRGQIKKSPSQKSAFDFDFGFINFFYLSNSFSGFL
jgi:hypothetical protein